jgi:hypothetical protein
LESIQLIDAAKIAGTAEKMALVNILAALDDTLLEKVIEHWLNLQVSNLKTEPKKFNAVRATMETLQSLKGNFNKKLVLSHFVNSSLT